AIGEDPAEFRDLRDDASLRRTVPGVVMEGRDGHIDEVPRGAARYVVAVLVGPGRGIGQRLSRFEQLSDDVFRTGREPRLRGPGPRADGPAGPRPGPAAESPRSWSRS